MLSDGRDVKGLTEVVKPQPLVKAEGDSPSIKPKKCRPPLLCLGTRPLHQRTSRPAPAYLRQRGHGAKPKSPHIRWNSIRVANRGFFEQGAHADQPPVGQVGTEVQCMGGFVLRQRTCYYIPPVGPQHFEPHRTRGDRRNGVNFH